MMITSNIEITKYLKDCRHFLGCFSSTNLPNFPQKLPTSLIVNVSGHWIAILLLKDVCLYFDSFGSQKYRNEKICYEVLNFLDNKYTTLFVNGERVQDYSSIKCAEFCLAFIKNVNSLDSYQLFLNNFDSKNKKNNDYIVKDLY